jgi:hypothetical protein
MMGIQELQVITTRKREEEKGWKGLSVVLMPGEIVNSMEKFLTASGVPTVLGAWVL